MKVLSLSLLRVLMNYNRHSRSLEERKLYMATPWISWTNSSNIHNVTQVLVKTSEYATQLDYTSLIEQHYTYNITIRIHRYSNVATCVPRLCFTRASVMLTTYQWYITVTVCSGPVPPRVTS